MYFDIFESFGRAMTIILTDYNDTGIEKETETDKQRQTDRCADRDRDRKRD